VTDDGRVECEYCGDKYKSQGLATHQRFCDTKPDEDDTEVTSDAVLFLSKLE
jgi:hypothetical protein